MAAYFHINYELSRAKALERIDARCSLGDKSGAGVTQPQRSEDGRSRHRTCPPGPEEGAAYVCVADGNVLVQVHRDPEYRAVVQGAMFSICDSSWVPLYLKRLYGFQPEQYSGSDIFRDITGARRYTMAFLGASQDVLDALKTKLTAEADPRIADMLFLALPYAQAEGFDYEGIAAEVNQADPDIVWVALGAPKQERFAARLAPLLRRGVVIPVGAVFNFRAGLGIRRAPDWMVKMHLEFVYRLFSEPRKQLRRVWQILRWTPAILREERALLKDQAR